MIDIGYVIKDIETCEYFCGMNTWNKQLRKAKIYHSVRYANDVMKDARFNSRALNMVKVEIKEAGLQIK